MKKYIDDVIRDVETDYDHAFIGAMDDDTVANVTACWLDTPAGQPGWDAMAPDNPHENHASVSALFQDEIQKWFLIEWENYLRDSE